MPGAHTLDRVARVHGLPAGRRRPRLPGIRSGIERIQAVVRTEIVGRNTLIDAKPWIWPLFAVLGEHPRCGAVGLDRRSTRTSELSLGESRDIGPMEGGAHRNRACGGRRGLSECRLPDRAGELVEAVIDEGGFAISPSRVGAEPLEHLPAALLRSALPPIPDDMELQAR
jgi:hypothetical protein